MAEVADSATAVVDLATADVVSAADTCTLAMLAATVGTEVMAIITIGAEADFIRASISATDITTTATMTMAMDTAMPIMAIVIGVTAAATAPIEI